MSKRTGLGRGLGAFFGNDLSETESLTNKETQTSVSATKEIENRKSESETEVATEKKSLEDLDMVLPGSKKQKKSTTTEKNSNRTSKNRNQSNKKKTASSNSSRTKMSGSESMKKEQITKIVEVEKEKYINISEIEPNGSQPRKIFDEEQLDELAKSIKHYGVLQPILVKKNGERYELIAGERRWRAAKLAGLREIPVIIREYTKQQTMEIALIENVQRADLNPIEEAKAYQMLIQEFGLRQEDVAEKVSKNRATITNSMRLLKLDERVQEMLIENRISSGHARALLSLEDGEKQYQIALKIVENSLSVRDVEKLVKELLNPKKPRKKSEDDQDLEIFFKDLEDKLKQVMGTKVSINRKDKNKGRIEIEYYSSAELERLIELLESLK